MDLFLSYWYFFLSYDTFKLLFKEFHLVFFMPVYISTITNDFCMLPLCLETLLNFWSLSVIVWFFLIYTVMLSANNERFTVLFLPFKYWELISYLLLFFFFLLFLHWLSSRFPVPCWLEVVITSLLSPLSHGESFQYFIIMFSVSLERFYVKLFM